MILVPYSLPDYPLSVTCMYTNLTHDCDSLIRPKPEIPLNWHFLRSTDIKRGLAGPDIKALMLFNVGSNILFNIS